MSCKTTEASAAILGLAISQGLSNYIGYIIGVNWRASLQKYLHGLYLHDKIMYRTNVLDDNPLDNIDNRITTDVNNVTIGLVGNLFNAFIPDIMIAAALSFYAFRIDWFSSLMTFAWTIGTLPYIDITISYCKLTHE
jgi:ABC-type uncharacterized transport system fused permease/ATPase subunit